MESTPQTPSTLKHAALVICTTLNDPKVHHTLTTKQAAEILNIHPQTMRGLIHACAIPAAKVGRAFVILTKDVIRYAENLITYETAIRMKKPTKARSQGQKLSSSRSA